MPGSQRLESAEVERRLAELPGWTLVDGRLHRELEFDSFPAAFAFMTAVAIHAQAMDHHPDWSNSYRKVTIDLVSHDVGGLSDRDFRLAAIIAGLSPR